MPKHIVELTAPPSVVPSSIGQHAIDTLNKKSYIAVGTAAVNDWQENGGGGGVGVMSSPFVEMNAAHSGNHDWDILTDGPLRLRVDKRDTGQITITSDLGVNLQPGEVVHNKLMLMIGSPASGTDITFTLSASTANQQYIDTFLSSADVNSFSLIENNQVITIDIIAVLGQFDENAGISEMIYLYKTSQVNVIVANSDPSGGG